MKKFSMTKAALYTAIGFTLIILIAIIHNWTNDRHSVEFVEATTFTHYENTPAQARIQISPALAWETISPGRKALGFFFLAMLWVSVWIVDSNTLHGKKSINDPEGRRPGLAILVIAIPLILSVVMFLGGYSNRFANNYAVVTKDRFDGWLSSGIVEKKGEKTYKDKADSIRTIFKSKDIVR